ncbi:hypothetical protein HJG60_008032 [Phyllostomus discolor]|uniref:Uncharacterized protein n=1 Tax=Phyllostomus discolor TaxID=89673 RepID=A0A834EVU0_9CHIR|nr:hypothetical protein HJG60_008032 [Phyllostomus discolor]
MIHCSKLLGCENNGATSFRRVGRNLTWIFLLSDPNPSSAGGSCCGLTGGGGGGGGRGSTGHEGWHTRGKPWELAFHSRVTRGCLAGRDRAALLPEHHLSLQRGSLWLLGRNLALSGHLHNSSDWSNSCNHCGNRDHSEVSVRSLRID